MNKSKSFINLIKLNSSIKIINRNYSNLNSKSPIIIGNEIFKIDEWTNTTNTILNKLKKLLHLNSSHPIGILRNLIENHFTKFKLINSLNPIVTPFQNFDELGFSKNHSGRNKTDSYYLNKNKMLRTHTSAHEVENFRKGYNKWLLTADVYRRDEIDKSHYPVFHQMEGANVVTGKEGIEILRKENEIMKKQLELENIIITDLTHYSEENKFRNPIQPEHSIQDSIIISEHLKLTLNSLVLNLFGGLRRRGKLQEGGKEEPLQIRWIEATFPWTSPSYEVEVLFEGKWLEILGCGVVKQDTLNRSGVPEKLGWAFGLGLERIAMVLFSIPDIRLFWSEDPRFLNQFQQGTISTFQPYSKHPACYKDFSFWIESNCLFHENDFCEIVRDVAGDLVEGVELIDEFVHPKTNRRSVCYRLNYRSMDRSLSNTEVNTFHAQVVDRVVSSMGVEVR